MNRIAVGALLVASWLSMACPERRVVASDPALPGIGRPDARLAAKLADATRGKGPGYRPRTRHLNPDGSPKFTNRLVLETSPYLLQHAHNPVNWYAWGDEACGAQTGFLTVLRQLDSAYRKDPERVLATAREITDRVREASGRSRSGAIPGPEAIRNAAVLLARSYDADHGGFGLAPKFPTPSHLALLARYHRRTGDPHALQMLETTLAKMAAGGIHDQIGGGFHRYSVDDRWLVPHFEKMLYDNAQLVLAYLDGYQITGRADFARVARDTLEYLARDMSDPLGGFYSATDADSSVPGTARREEGRYFTWTPEEVTAALGKNAFLDLHEATQDPRWLSEAIALHALLEKRFWDERAGGFFQTPHDHEALLAREKPAYDGAEPSGNSVAILNLLRLEELTGIDRYRTMAEQALAAFASDLRDGSEAEMMLSALDFRLDTPLEIVVVSPPGGGATPFEAVLRRTFVPNRIYAAATEGPELEERARLIPLLSGKRALRGMATAYVCRERTCDLPTSDPTVFSAQLARTEPLFRDASVTPLPTGAAIETR